MPLLKFLRSTVGLKFIVGLTGAALFAFVIIHMVGNLQIFLGPEALNTYAQFLHASPEVIWGFRLGLGAVAIVHIVGTITLTIRNRAARGSEPYAEYAAYGSTVASRTMAVTGIIVAAFIVFHLLHFTVQSVDPSFLELKDAEYAQTHPGFERHDVFAMVVKGFSVPWVTLLYVVGVGLVCFHLSHGIESFFRSIGLTNPAYRGVQEIFGTAFAIIIFVGMSIVPISVLAGFIHL
jgi:succinate dehydrogenase / fumarate reductase, cytochrome b subunit